MSPHIFLKMQTDKFFFTSNKDGEFLLCPKNPRLADMQKRWFVYNTAERDKRYKKNPDEKVGLNDIKDFEQRLTYAQNLIAYLNEQKYGDKPAPKRAKPPGLMPSASKVVSVLQDLIDTNIRIRESTRRCYNAILGVFSNWLAVSKTEIIDKSAARKYVLFVMNTMGRKNKTVNTHRGLLQSLIKKAMREDLLDFEKNPFADMETLPNETEGNGFFNKQQIVLIRDYIQDKKPQLWLGCQFLFYTYIRPRREMRRLKISDIDFSNKRIKIRGTISKNRKTRYVAIPDAFMPYLLFLVNYPSDYYIFGSGGEPNNIPIGYNTLSDAHQTALKKLGITEGTMYWWKSTGMVEALGNGVPIEELQIQAGHHSLDQLKQYLTKLTESQCTTLRNCAPDMKQISEIKQKDFLIQRLIETLGKNLANMDYLCPKTERKLRELYLLMSHHLKIAP